MPNPHCKTRAFTLVEVLVASAIVLLLMGIVFSMTSTTAGLWKASSNRLESTQKSRDAFEIMSRKLSQATVNTYYDYFDNNGRASSDPAYSGVAHRYGRQSELHFVTGKSLVPDQISHAVFFQAPLGDVMDKSLSPLNSLLNACGYFVQFGNDASTSSLSGRPAFLNEAGIPLRYRYRLMELSQPSEGLEVYRATPGGPNGWFAGPLAATPPQTRLLAENVIALVLLPKESEWVENSKPIATRIGANFEYDSKTSWSDMTKPQPMTMNQICPLLKIAMVVLDESSALRLQGSSVDPPDLGVQALFQTAAELDSDMGDLQRSLTQKNLTYRVYQTELAIRSSQWSQR